MARLLVKRPESEGVLGKYSNLIQPGGTLG